MSNAVTVDIVDDEGSVLGNVPHQIRGSVSSFSNLEITGRAYARCTACSRVIVDTYLRDGEAFLSKVWNEPGYLEEITGLRRMREETEK